MELTQEINHLKYKLMEIFNEHFFERVKEATKEGYLEAMFEYEQYRKRRKTTKDVDLISKNQAYKLIGRARVDELIIQGLIQPVSSGRSKNSVQHLSKKKLLELNNTYL